MAGLVAASDQTSQADSAPHVELRDIWKRFAGVQALEAVSLQIDAGSVHALVGENGAGKSTLGKIVAGVLAPDRGRVLLNGAPVSLRSPRHALEHGIAAITQELALVPGLSVAENVFLGAEPRLGAFVRRGLLRQRYTDLSTSAGFHLPPDQLAGRLSTARQQQVEILRALCRNAQLIVMDEPSASLSGAETTTLHAIIRSLARAGKTILLISHYLHQVLQLADTVTILRDGRLVRTSPASQETEDSLVQAMLGRSLKAAFPAARGPRPEAPVALYVRGLSATGVTDVSFNIRAGEIVGLFGLVGAGRTELARAIFGAQPITRGSVEVASGRRIAKKPRLSLVAGVTMIPESRKRDGLLSGRSVAENVSLASLHTLSRLGLVRRGAERRKASSALERVGIRSVNLTAPVGSLSGGNQQKVLFARMLLCRPAVLLADEPTRGVDAGARRTIYSLLASLADAGLAVLLISSEVEEILGLADRVLVMRGGRIAAEFNRQTMTESSVIGAAFANVPSTDVSE